MIKRISGTEFWRLENTLLEKTGRYFKKSQQYPFMHSWFQNTVIRDSPFFYKYLFSFLKVTLWRKVTVTEENELELHDVVEEVNMSLLIFQSTFHSSLIYKISLLGPFISISWKKIRLVGMYRCRVQCTLYIVGNYKYLIGKCK